jgi:membrane protease YdiL (CAAX protease family)
MKNRFWLALAIYLLFCGLSYFSEPDDALFALVTLIGIGFPLAYAKWTGNWAALGFRKTDIAPSIQWGILGGILSGLIGLAVLPSISVPSRLGLQLLIGVPMWALIASPFQEFFFRGYLQPIVQARFGDLRGLLLANLGFTLWHYCAPFSGSPVPLNSVLGFVSTFLAGLAYAYVFYRTKHIIAPWLAHLLTGTIFIIVGAMDFASVLS